MSDFQSENEGSIPFICSNILERFGNPAGLISLSKWVRLSPPELTKFYDMEDSKLMTCIIGSSVRDIINQARELEIQREDIVNMFVLREQVYLVYYS